MNLFWRNGYESTSMQMLEKEMGINKFSIYSSFENKNGVFLESIKCYRQKLNRLLSNLKSSTNGVESIKEYFYNFVEFSKDNGYGKGCLVTNTANEIGQDADKKIKDALSQFTENVRAHFAEILRRDQSKDNEIIEQQADYLIIAMFGLASASRTFNPSQLENYIENIFKSL
ncbi:TetR/AcrR family transcriptional regulator [Catalinimonas alkaloidigena]|uniref:TetR/AcrR family transcriptional regulator n=1 Tax=Catalinimonas alkaloidigena TaxID=1075417 RepID=UPI0024062C34|nr:TetR/AcrR family transcriptional regulator [Catalinimonas alkaloidigena]